MNFVKVKVRRHTVSSLTSGASNVIYEDAYVNLNLVNSVFIFGDIARLIFSGVPGDYINTDKSEWEKIVKT